MPWMVEAKMYDVRTGPGERTEYRVSYHGPFTYDKQAFEWMEENENKLRPTPGGIVQSLLWINPVTKKDRKE